MKPIRAKCQNMARFLSLHHVWYRAILPILYAVDIGIFPRIFHLNNLRRDWKTVLYCCNCHLLAWSQIVFFLVLLSSLLKSSCLNIIKKKKKEVLPGQLFRNYFISQRVWSSQSITFGSRKPWWESTLNQIEHKW